MTEYVYVLDCSVTMSWLIQDEENLDSIKLREELFEGQAIVPSLWSLEVANVLLQSEKKKRITPFQSSACIKLLQNMPIQIDSKTSELAMNRVLELSREYKLSIYDACYLELSLRLPCPLATLDKQLTLAAKGAGIPVLPSPR